MLIQCGNDDNMREWKYYVGIIGSGLLGEIQREMMIKHGKALASQLLRTLSRKKRKRA